MARRSEGERGVAWPMTNRSLHALVLPFLILAARRAPADDRAATAVKAPAVGRAQTGTMVAATPRKNDFALSLSPASVSLPPGGHATFTVSTHVTSGSPASVSFAVSGLPGGVSGSFSPASVAGGGGTTLTLAASASAAPGSQTFTVTGASSAVTHALHGVVAITVAPKNDFAIALSPSSAALSPGAQATFTVSTSVVSGAPMSIVLSVSGLPPGVTGTLSPSAVSSGGNATLTLAASASAASASTTFVVTGTAGAASHAAKASVAVQTGSLRALPAPR